MAKKKNKKKVSKSVAVKDQQLGKKKETAREKMIGQSIGYTNHLFSSCFFFFPSCWSLTATDFETFFLFFFLAIITLKFYESYLLQQYN